MNQNSLDAWMDKRTQEKAKSDVLKIMKRLISKPNQSARQLSSFFENKESIRKRCSDLCRDGLIVVTGERMENGYKNSTYSVNIHYSGKTPKKVKVISIKEMVDTILSSGMVASTDELLSAAQQLGYKVLVP